MWYSLLLAQLVCRCYLVFNMLNMINIGSDYHCRIRIAEAGVSPFHASLSLDGELICMELSPGCTAMLNDNMVEGKYWLQSEDKVVIGDTRLNLYAIKTLLSEPDNESGMSLVIEDGASKEVSDAVVIKSNPWPIIIIVAIIMWIVFFYVRNMMQYREHSAQIRQEIQVRKDSILKTERTMDSLNDKIKQLQNE